MNSQFAPLEDYQALLAKIDMPLITQYIPIHEINSAIAACEAKEKRLRRLPAWLVVLLSIMKGIYCRESWPAAFAKICLIPCFQTGFNLADISYEAVNMVAICTPNFGGAGRLPAVWLVGMTAQSAVTLLIGTALFFVWQRRQRP